MSDSYRLVCPFEPSLLERLSGQRVVLRLQGRDDLAAARDVIGRQGMPILEWLWLSLTEKLDEVPFEVLDCELQLALSVSGFGSYLGVRRRLSRLLRPGTRVYMSFVDAETAEGFRILSSLRVPTAVILPDGGPFDWEALSDLATYALLTPVEHAMIEPFSTLARFYKPSIRQSWAFCYAEDPARYLHLDRHGNVAVSPGALAEGRFVGECSAGLKLFKEAPFDGDWWRRHFLQRDACASCPGFRICSGWLAGLVEPGAACSRFMADLLEVVEKARTLDDQARTTIWQL
jgi:hypothetical protein